MKDLTNEFLESLFPTDKAKLDLFSYLNNTRTGEEPQEVRVLLDKIEANLRKMIDNHQ